MSKKGLNILLIGLNELLVLLLLVNVQELHPLFQFLGRLHPLILHFPIVLIIVAFLFEYLSRKSEQNDFGKPADIMLWAGAFSAVITAIAGFLLSLNGEYSGDSFLFHKWFGLATSVASMGIVYLSNKYSTHQIFMPLYGLLIGLLVVTGHFGATLTHGEGFLTDVFEEKQTLALNTEAPIFDQIVFPILDSKCTGCHNESKLKGKLLLTSKGGIMKGGESGDVIVNGDTEKSLLIKNLHLPQEDDAHMPPKGKNQLTAAELKMLTWWVASGASFEQPVREITKEDPIQITLASYFAPKEKINIDFASPALIESLSDEHTSISQISAELPYLEVRIGHNKDLTSSDLKSLRKIKKQVRTLDLGNSNVDKSILNEIANFKNLARLYLDNTPLDDDMASGLKKMKNITYLNLYGTKITKKGAEKLIKLPQLKQLFLWQTDIDMEEIAALQNDYPGIEINGGLAADSEFTTAQLVPPIMDFTSSFFENEMTIDIDYSLSGTEIFYQLDEEPLQLVKADKIEINKSVKLKVIARKDGWEDSELIEQVFIKVTKTDLKASKLTYQPKGEYLGNGVASLFDLSKGSENFRDGKWLGFNGDDLIVDIELNKSKPITSVYLSTIDDLGSWIFPPSTIEVWGGTEKGRLVKLTEESFVSPDGPAPKKMQIHQLHFNIKTIKFLQVRAKNYGKLPDWHPGKGNPTWLFIDEIAFD